MTISEKCRIEVDLSLRLIAFFLAGICFLSNADSQTVITECQPRTCQPGKATQLTFTGQALNESLRIASSLQNANFKVTSIEATKAVIECTLPKDAPLGPFGIWVASNTGVSEPFILLADDLPADSDNGNNHSIATAQTIPALVSIEGKSDGPKSDFYRLKVVPKQRIAFQVMTQAIESAMDPVVRLLDESGTAIYSADDDEIGPDCRFEFQFPQAGEYTLEIHDNRYAAGGRYQLRVGDFPIVHHAIPLAIKRGQPTEIRFSGPDAASIPLVSTTVAADYPHHNLNVAARFAEGKSSAWLPVQLTDNSIFGENDTLTIPCSLSGQLLTTNERDSVSVQGVKDNRVRFSSRTRSLQCATMLQMELINSKGTTVAATKPENSDEWSFEYTFPDNEIYQLMISDLLGRGGNAFGYLIDVTPVVPFSVAFKADAKLPEQFAMELGHGACVVDIQVLRVGYDGEIELSLEPRDAGLRIVNPTIASKAKDAKITFAVTKDWKPDSIITVQIHASAKDNPVWKTQVNSLALHRVK